MKVVPTLRGVHLREEQVQESIGWPRRLTIGVVMNELAAGTTP